MSDGAQKYLQLLSNFFYFILEVAAIGIKTISVSR